MNTHNFRCWLSSVLRRRQTPIGWSRSWRVFWVWFIVVELGKKFAIDLWGGKVAEVITLEAVKLAEQGFANHKNVLFENVLHWSILLAEWNACFNDLHVHNGAYFTISHLNKARQRSSQETLSNRWPRLESPLMDCEQ